MKRFIYSLKKSLLHANDLSFFLKKQGKIKSLLEIDPDFLKREKIKVLALDFDGVLSPYAAFSPTKTLQVWLETLSQNWSGKIFILSNKPFPARQDFMQQHFPHIQFITHVAKKPYPAGLLRIIEEAHCQASEVLMIDDRLLTGILAAQIAQTKALLISHPLRQWRGQQGFHEVFFSCLRWLDKMWIQLINRF